MEKEERPAGRKGLHSPQTATLAHSKINRIKTTRTIRLGQRKPHQAIARRVRIARTKSNASHELPNTAGIRKTGKGNSSPNEVILHLWSNQT